MYQTCIKHASRINAFGGLALSAVRTAGRWAACHAAGDSKHAQKQYCPGRDSFLLATKVQLPPG